MSKLSNAARRLTKKQRLKRKREQEAAHKRFMRRGYIGAANRTDRPVRATESPRDRHQREQREREEARRAERAAEHELIVGKRWVVAAACVGRETQLLAKLREASVPYFRPRDDVVQVLPSGRVRKLQVPVMARTVFVGVDDRKHLERLGERHPWLMERVPRQRHGRVDSADHGVFDRGRFGSIEVGDCAPEMPGATFPWLIDHVERMTATDDDGLPCVVTALVSEKQMRAFADCLIGASPLMAGNDPFEIGEVLRITGGPFASFNGTVEQIDVGSQRLTVAASIFGRATPVELEFGQVERT